MKLIKNILQTKQERAQIYKRIQNKTRNLISFHIWNHVRDTILYLPHRQIMNKFNKKVNK